MIHTKHIAATLALLGTASFTVAGCNKNKEGTEVPAATEKKGDGSCGAKGDGSCGAKGDGSCGAKPADATAPASPEGEKAGEEAAKPEPG